jgi:choice-of-anchor B domain-containing protein
MPPRILSSTSLLLCAFAHLLAAPGTAQISSRFVLESHIPQAPCTTAGLWAIGDYLLVARRAQGFAVVDARIPAQPRTVTIRPPGYPAPSGSFGVGDIKSDGRYIYATNENWWVNAGVFIYDAGADPMNPTYVGAVQHANVPWVHNCWIDRSTDTLYCVGRGRIQVFDVRDKTAPQFLATIGDGLPGLAHDVVVLDGRAYCSFWDGGIAIYDVRNPSNPRLLGHHQYAGAATHNMWPSEDRRFLYTTDEKGGGEVLVWDISNLPQTTLVGVYRAGPPGSMVHNVHVRDDLLFVAYFKEGVRVCSLRDPIRPVEIAHYDTYAAAEDGCFGAIAGCWGVYPFHTFGVFASDIDSGVYLLRLDPVGHSFTPRTPTVSPGGMLTLDFAFRNDAPAPLQSFGAIFLTKINAWSALTFLSYDGALLAPLQDRTARLDLPIPAVLPIGWTLSFRAYSGTLDPTIVSETTDLSVTVR